MEDFRYFKNESDGVWSILLNGAIGQEADGVQVAYEIKAINEATKRGFITATEIQIRINSPGGGVINGMSVVSAILNSEIPVNTFNDGFAYSMAGIIFAVGKKRAMVDFGGLMIHEARLNGKTADQVKDPKDKELLEAMNGQLTTILSNQTGKTKAEIKALLKAETFYTATEAKAEGFSDETITTKRKPEFTKDMTTVEMVAAINKLNSNLNNEIMPDFKLVTNELKLNGDASEASIVQAIQDLKKENADISKELKDAQESVNKAGTEAAQLKAEKEKLEAKIKDFEKRESELKEAEAKALVDKAIKDGFYNEDNREMLTKNATENLPMFKAMIEGFTPKAATITDQLGATQKPKATDIDKQKEAACKEFNIKVEDMKVSTFDEQDKWDEYNDLKAKYPELAAVMEAEYATEPVTKKEDK
jgi:ATP-dependent protease ClpP protease subunit/predicted nuclease with TOPRIM domain